MNNKPPNLDVLIVAPHPDDAELGMGGAIAKFLQTGNRVGILDLTSGEPTPFGSPEIRKKETALATELLGLTWRGNLGLPNRSLEATLENREKLAGIFRLTQAPWIFAPYWEDAHPDHVAALSLIEDARFWAKLSKTNMPGKRYHPKRIYNYYCVHLKQSLNPAFVLDITEFWAIKKQSIEAYQSQFVIGREAEQPSLIEKIETEAKYWGHKIGVQYGEPFHCKEPLGLRNLSALI